MSVHGRAAYRVIYGIGLGCLAGAIAMIVGVRAAPIGIVISGIAAVVLSILLIRLPRGAIAAVILVDTDVLIAHLRGVHGASSWLMTARSSGGPLAVSVISVMELEGGMRSNERRPVATLLSALRTIDVDSSIARRAGELMRKYRRSHSGIGLGEYIIAATAQVGGHELGTLNVRHFPMFEDLRPSFQMHDG